MEDSPESAMLHEIKNAKKYDEGIRTRWFSDDYFDLVVWYDDDNSMISFQLTYDKYNDPHALTWKLGKGYAHETIDDGENPGRYKQSPILIPDGDFEGDIIAHKFMDHSIKAESELTGTIFKIISSLDRETETQKDIKTYPVFIELSFTQREKKRLLKLAQSIFIPKSTGDIVAVRDEYELQQQIHYMTSRIKLSESRFIMLCTLVIKSYKAGLLTSKEDLSITNKILEYGKTFLNKAGTESEKLQPLLNQIKELIRPLDKMIKNSKEEVGESKTLLHETIKNIPKPKISLPKKGRSKKNSKAAIKKGTKILLEKAATLSDKIHDKIHTLKQNSAKNLDSESNETMSTDQLKKARLLAKRLKGKR